ncbi:hypothetical protein E2C01_083649 [Portunus trituberculatus]|uniref:Uncharacterized protein n=1 Tax=Portunus trituberculatus TaxID=210409 RepID=A0A5B7IVQ5_PORTR|nr:hypothetical protein [Portunus trituberculatus]
MLKDALLQASVKTRLSHLQQLNRVKLDGRHRSVLFAHMLRIQRSQQPHPARYCGWPTRTRRPITL